MTEATSLKKGRYGGMSSCSKGPYNEKSRCPKAAAPQKTELISTEIKRPGGP